MKLAGPEDGFSIIGGCGSCGDPFVHGDSVANARLIASAPDLLEALECAVYDMDNFENLTDTIENCKRAIAKAKGVTEAERAAFYYFYPNNCWGGYDKFFSPSIPSKIGSILVGSINQAVKGDRASLDEAVAILSKEHTKDGELCSPTREAKTAVLLLIDMHNERCIFKIERK